MDETKPKDVMETSTVMTVSIPLWIFLKISLEAKEAGLSRSALIASVLKVYLGKTRPLVFAGASKELSPGELGALGDPDLLRKEEEERKAIMDELLPPPEKDPDLCGEPIPDRSPGSPSRPSAGEAASPSVASNPLEPSASASEKELP